MTNNEIVIALRAVAKNYEGKFVRTFETNINAMATDAADHIERLCEENNFLKAEIERLQKDLDIINAVNTELYGAFEENERLKSEIERLEKIRSELSKEVEGFADHNKQLRYDVKKIRTEARKEFVNMAKKHIYKNVSAPTPGQRYVMNKFTELLDNLVKEMENETK